MGAVVEYPTLEHVAMFARPYPVEELAGCETGLVLFAAAYLGHNDAVHFAEAGLETTCVDRDSARLEAMRALYPEEWRFVAADAWTFAEAAAREEIAYDVVSLDPFSGDCMDRVWSDLSPWTAITNRTLIVGTIYGLTYRKPRGWSIAGADVERAPGVWWHVLRRS